MKKTVLTFGFISGALSSLMMVLTVPFLDRIGFDRAEVLGYTTIVASFLLVFFGIRSYRDRVVRGPLTFGRAFTVGILITLVSSACYVATWKVVRHRLAPGFVDRYSAHQIERVRDSGGTQQEIDATTRQIESMKRIYRNPLMSAAITFLEPFPIGLVVTLISSAVLRRRSGSSAPAPSGA